MSGGDGVRPGSGVPAGSTPVRLSAEGVAALLDRSATRRVLVVGDLMVDHYIAGRVDRISPEAPVPVLRVEGEERRLGGAANVAANVAALGARCDVVGCVGEDEGRALLERGLELAGISTGGIVSDAARPTSVKTRLMARAQQVARYDRESDRPVSGAVEERILGAIEAALPGAHAVAIEDYNKGVLTPAVIRATLSGARERGLPVVVDPKRHHFFDFTGATVFKPNLRELEDALGRPLRLDDSDELDEVRRRVGADHLVLTLGERGMLLSGSSEVRRLPATARSVYDVSGAGDTVTAVMCLALATEASVADGAILANLAAGVGVGKAGVAPVSPAELLAEMHRLTDLEGSGHGTSPPSNRERPGPARTSSTRVHGHEGDTA